MSKKLLTLGLTLALALFLVPFTPPAGADEALPGASRAQTVATAEPVPAPEVEEIELDSDPTTSGSDAASIVCRFGHWRNGPRQCQIQHIDGLIGPLAPCSYIKVGGRWYHIVYIVGRVLGLRALSGTPVPEG